MNVCQLLVDEVRIGKCKPRHQFLTSLRYRSLYYRYITHRVEEERQLNNKLERTDACPLFEQKKGLWCWKARDVMNLGAIIHICNIETSNKEISGDNLQLFFTYDVLVGVLHVFMCFSIYFVASLFESGLAETSVTALRDGMYSSPSELVIFVHVSQRFLAADAKSSSLKFLHILSNHFCPCDPANCPKSQNVMIRWVNKLR